VGPCVGAWASDAEGTPWVPPGADGRGGSPLPGGRPPSLGGGFPPPCSGGGHDSPTSGSLERGAPPVGGCPAPGSCWAAAPAASKPVACPLLGPQPCSANISNERLRLCSASSQRFIEIFMLVGQQQRVNKQYRQTYSLFRSSPFNHMDSSQALQMEDGHSETSLAW
jgi:hypothetical protein